MKAVAEQICDSVEVQSGRRLAEDPREPSNSMFPYGWCHGDLCEASHEINYAIKPQLLYLNLFFPCSWQAGGLICLDVIIHFLCFPFYI